MTLVTVGSLKHGPTASGGRCNPSSTHGGCGLAGYLRCGFVKRKGCPDGQVIADLERFVERYLEACLQVDRSLPMQEFLRMQRMVNDVVVCIILSRVGHHLFVQHGRPLGATSKAGVGLDFPGTQIEISNKQDIVFLSRVETLKVI